RRSRPHRRLLHRPAWHRSGGSRPGHSPTRRPTPGRHLRHPTANGVPQPETRGGRTGRRCVRRAGSLPRQCWNGRCEAVPLAFRNVTADPSDPVTEWPTEAVQAALERGALEHWQRLTAEIKRRPWGRTARQVKEVLSHSRPYGIAEL